jgi:hypothetical protein
MITKGVAKYVYLDSTEKYQGEDTGKYTLTVGITNAEAKKLEDIGVKVRTITDQDTGKDIKIRKFSTQYKLQDNMIQTEGGDVIGTDFGAGSGVQVLWKAGKAHPTHGVATYLTAIKVADEHEPGFKGANEEISDFLSQA